jgi:hypothetical protein
MVIFKNLISATALGVLLGPITAHAQTMSLPEQQAEAQRLTALCKQDPQYVGFFQQAQAGSMRASYEAAAAMIQCFYNNVDPRYPANLKAAWLEKINQNKALAQQYQ